MEKPRTLMGDAPRLLLVVGPAMLLAVVAEVLFPGVGSFTLRYRGLFVWAAVLLAALAVPFWISAGYELLRAWRGRGLATRGAYGLCRHPIFAVWIWFVLPVTAFFADSWYFLAAAAVFLLASSGGARREERALLAEFGEEYESYRARVRSLLPLPRLRPFTGRRILKGAAWTAVLVVYGIAVTAVFAVPAARRLGASGVEATMQLPGDELSPAPTFGYTQAVTVKAPPEQVWSWLVQVGYRRAGWYNVDALNRMASDDYFVDGERSSVRIHPELQGLAVGDSVGLAPGLAFDVVALEPNRYFTIAKIPGPDVSQSDPGYLKAVWTFYLKAEEANATRLIVRYRTEVHGGFFQNLWIYFSNDIGGAMLQQPAMLHGVKRRAEQM